MKGTNLFLVGIVLLLGFVSFAYAEVNDSNVSLNETPLDENQTGQAIGHEGAEGVILGDLEAVVERNSPLDKVISYASEKIDKVNEIHHNLFFVVFIVLWVLLLLIYSVFFNYSSAESCFSKASLLHGRAQKAHVNGNYTKADRLYNKSYLFRKKGERIISEEDDDGSI